MQDHKPLIDPIDLLKEAIKPITKNIWLVLALTFPPVALEYFSTTLYANTGNWLLSALLSCLGIILLIPTTIGLVKVFAGQTSVRIQSVFTLTKEEYFSFLLVLFLGIMVTGLGYLLILPGIYCTIRYVFAPFTHVLEGKKGWKAMKASADLTASYFFALLGRIALLVALFIIYLYFLKILFMTFWGEALWSQSLSTFIAGMTIVPYAMSYLYLLYDELSGFRAKISQ